MRMSDWSSDVCSSDLLVRAFRTPENAGCGIAWLIGGGETGIVQADAPFGYSVVSDGTDLDEGDDNTYFCREETLAHRSEERRVGKECVRTCRSRGSPLH